MSIPGPEDEVRALRERAYGLAFPGIITIRDFHQGVVTTTGAKIMPWRGRDAPNNPHYFLTIPGIDTSSANLPGVPIAYSYPEDVFEKYAIPLVMVRFDGFEPAMQRWHPGMETFRIPAPGADLVTVEGNRGFTRYLRQQQAPPYDFNYTMVVEARHRGIPGGQKNQALLILQYLLSIYQPYTFIEVLDSVGDTRKYYAEAGSIVPEDEIFDVADRTIGFSFPLRVEGELDLRQPAEVISALQRPTQTVTQG